MKYFFVALILFPFIFFSSCTLESDTDTVTGSILVSTTNVKVGAFHYDLLFSGSSSGDEVTSISFGTAPYTPIVLGTITGSTYTITFPEDEDTMGAFIAWEDTDGDDLLDDGENAYFPMKDFDGTDHVVTIGYVLGYTANHYDGSTNYIESLDTVGTSGFDFTID